MTRPLLGKSVLPRPPQWRSNLLQKPNHVCLFFLFLDYTFLKLFFYKMSTKTGIYHWKLGDVALARICKKVYAKVQVVKNEYGLFHDEKGILIFDLVFFSKLSFRPIYNTGS